MASFQKIKTYARREVKALCVLLILLIKSLVLKKTEQVSRHVSIQQSKSRQQLVITFRFTLNH